MRAPCTAPATVTLERRITHVDGRRIYPVAPERRTCTVVCMRAQYVAVQTPTGEEVWVDRSTGTIGAPRGGVPGVQGAPTGARGRTAWASWTLSRADLSLVWVESAQVDAAVRREDARRERDGR